MPDVMKVLAKEDPFVPSVFEKVCFVSFTGCMQIVNFIFTEIKKFDCVVCFYWTSLQLFCISLKKKQKKHAFFEKSV